jgi:PPOX class probable F420-dependent enzyme
MGYTVRDGSGWSARLLGRPLGGRLGPQACWRGQPGTARMVTVRPPVASHGQGGREQHMTGLPERARELIDGLNFATVVTVQPDGGPQASVVWVKRDGDDVLYSTVTHRRKYLNLLADPRTSLVIYEAANPYEYLEIRGTVTLTADPDGALIEELAQKYTGEAFQDAPGNKRVIVRVHPEHVVIGS